MSDDSPYDAIARLYDPWSASVTEDVDFYVEEAGAAGGTVVELACGTGRITVPIAEAGVHVIGVDASPGMLEVAAERVRAAGVQALVELRLGDLRDPPVAERVPLVLVPFRSLLHLTSERDRERALQAIYELLLPEGRLVFDVFAPSADDVEATHGRWLEREPGIFERADWDEGARTLTLSVRRGEEASTMLLAWLSPLEWRQLLERAGFEIEALWGWFDRRPHRGEEDFVFAARRP
ncbi:MAG TPA: class I SAM-dependent methyltransferase [Gaiellaceae bacterium]|jgi:SAM-dependent methyltransferase|nr:class I SAM-dependent methyltransferase [Gaiellaceae bacterium]